MVSFDAVVWVWSANHSWHFVTLPEGFSEEIRANDWLPSRGFGSVRVQALVGQTSWPTSIFPSKEQNSYILPLKKDVRRREDIINGDTITVTLTLVDEGQESGFLEE